MITNRISIYVCWFCIAICLLAILDVHVCYGQTGANAALYFIPTKVNLYPNHGLAAGDAQDIIDDINRRFRDNDFPVRLVNVGVETITADHGGNNNWGGDNGAGGGTAGDGDLTDAEGWEDNNSVSAYGDNEVQNLSNHKGVKVSFVNATHSGGIWPGWCFHCQPTIVISLPRALDRANNENGRGLTGVEAAAETIMHELGHVMGDLSHGHTFGTGNFMTPSNTRTGTDMDDTQKDAMLEDKYKHAKCAYQWNQYYPGIPLENLFGNGLDEVLDVSGGAGDDDTAFLQNTGHLDIQQIYLVGLDSSTQAVFDDTRNIDVHYRVAGAIPTDQSIEATYTLGFDIDDDLSTGAIHGGRLGIDRVVTVLATGRISDGTFQLNGSVEDLVTGTTVNLPGVITYDTDRPFPDDTGLSEPTATIFRYKIPKNLLNWSADDVPVVVTAGTSTAVRDTTEFIFETKRWLKDPLLQTFGEGVPIPGEPYPFEVTGLEPDSPFQLYLNDTLMLSGQLDSSGGYRGDFVFPPSLTTREPHFLTVLDSTGEFAYGMACPDPSFARLPYPEDDSTHPHTWVFFTWSSGAVAVSHDIYLGENLVSVEAGTDETFRGNQIEPFFIAGFPGYPYPEGLVRGTTYYWRIDEIGADGMKYPGEVWSFTVPPMTAYDPMPADGTSVKGPDVTLSWKPGIGAMLHEVYFGENFDDVNNAIGGISQTATTYNPGILELGVTYYWRVDEFDGIATYRGDVWSFTVLNGRWEKLNGPYGCYVADMAVDPTNPQTIYMATDSSGIYKSPDGGLTWATINRGIPSYAHGGWDIAIDPENPQNLYYGSWVAGLFRSTDGGSNWEYKLGELGAPCLSAMDIAISPIDSRIQYIATNIPCVYKSEDRGDTWVLKNNGFPENTGHLAIAISPNDPNVVYVSTQVGSSFYLYKTTNGGDIWLNKSNGLDTSKFIWAIATHSLDKGTLYLATEDGVYKSVDGAESWSQTNNGLTNIYTRDITIDQRNPDVLYVATWKGLFKSTNGGSNWIGVDRHFVSRCVKTVDLDPSNPDIVYAGVWGGVHISTDSGATWSFHDKGLSQELVVADNGLAIDPTNPDTIYVGTYGGGVAKSHDGGRSFEYINNGLDHGYCVGLYISPHDPQTLFCAVRGGDSLYKTTDGGNNWFALNTRIVGYTSHTAAFDPIDPNVFYYCSHEGIQKTTSGGEGWSTTNRGLTDRVIRNIAIDPNDSQIIYVTTQDSGVFKSTDGGNSWFQSNEGLSDLATNGIAIDPRDPLTVYVGTLSGVFKSVDGGGYWIRSSKGIENKEVRRLIVGKLTPHVIYAQTRLDGIFKSVDGGSSWHAFNEGLNNLFMAAITLDPQNPSSIFMGTGDGVYKWAPYQPVKMSAD